MLEHIYGENERNNYMKLKNKYVENEGISDMQNSEAPKPYMFVSESRI